MFDDHEAWPSGVPVAGTLLVIAVVVLGVLVVGGYADDLVDDYEGEPSPQASFSFSYDDTTETLTVRHSGGDTIEGRHLFVVAGNATLESFATYDVVRSGDRIRLEDVERTDDVRVIWSRGDRAVVIARWSR